MRSASVSVPHKKIAAGRVVEQNSKLHRTEKVSHGKTGRINTKTGDWGSAKRPQGSVVYRRSLRAKECH